MSLLQIRLRLGVGFHGFALLWSQLLWDDQFDCHVMVAFLMMVRWKFLDTVVGDLFPFLVPCAWRDPDCDIAVECFNSQLCAQHSLTDVQVQVCVNVRAFSLEVAMIAHLNVHYQVTVRTT